MNAAAQPRAEAACVSCAFSAALGADPGRPRSLRRAGRGAALTLGSIRGAIRIRRAARRSHPGRRIRRRRARAARASRSRAGGSRRAAPGRREPRPAALGEGRIPAPALAGADGGPRSSRHARHRVPGAPARRRSTRRLFDPARPAPSGAAAAARSVQRAALAARRSSRARRHARIHRRKRSSRRPRRAPRTTSRRCAKPTRRSPRGATTQPIDAGSVSRCRTCTPSPAAGRAHGRRGSPAARRGRARRPSRARSPAAGPRRQPSAMDAADSMPARRHRRAPRRARPAPRIESARAARASARGDSMLQALRGRWSTCRASRGDRRPHASQLRERLVMLDADDQVAAMLSLRNSLKQLEAQVAELQLKLSEMPRAWRRPRCSAPAAKAESRHPRRHRRRWSPPIAPRHGRRAPRYRPRSRPICRSGRPCEAAPPAARRAARPAAPEAAPPAAVERPRPRRRAVPVDRRLPGWARNPPAALRATFRAGCGLSWPSCSRARSRRAHSLWRPTRRPIAAARKRPWQGARPRRSVHGRGAEDAWRRRSARAAAVAVRGPARREIDIGRRAHHAHPEENADDLRRRYIEERFPEIGKRAHRPRRSRFGREGRAPVLRGRRHRRAPWSCCSSRSSASPPRCTSWLALFEIFRLERLTGEFAELARRFREQHGKTDYWRKVQYFGREIDPGNALYQESAHQHFETIGPAQAKRWRRRRASIPSRRTGSARPWTSKTRCSPTSCARR